MCKLGFYIGKQTNITKQIMLATAKWGEGNSHGTGVAWKDEEKINIIKEPIEATHFWDKTDVEVNTTNAIFHVRYATTGEKTIANTHPFYDKVSGISIVHNGVINNYDDAKKELVEKGFSFQGECDSEVFLWAYIYKGIDYIDWLNEKGVTGSASVLIQDGNKIIAFTNNNTLQMFETPTGIMGFSNDVLGYSEKYKAFEVEKNTIYEVTDNVYILKENTKLKEYSYSYSYDTFDVSKYYGNYLNRRTKQTKLVEAEKEKDLVADDEKIAMKKYYRAKFGNKWKKEYCKELTRYRAELNARKLEEEMELQEYNYGYGYYD